VTGGIGTGKSTVCRICALKGIPVYDCDSQARHIMDTSPDIHSALRRIAGPDVVSPSGSIHRPALARAMFGSPQVRASVNALVHSRVRSHFAEWVEQRNAPLVLIESAIMATASLHKAVDAIWLVEAPMSLRIDRVMRRSGLSRQSIIERINAQRGEIDALPPALITTIANDGRTSLLTTIDTLLNNIYSNA